MTTSTAYTRREARRILKIPENRLRSWERHGFFEPASEFNFPDLNVLRVLQRLRQDRIPSKRIKDSLSSLAKKLPGVERPLWELKIVPSGRLVAVELPTGKMEALTGQMLFDFDAPAEKPPKTVSHSDGRSLANRLREAEIWFRRGLELEDQGEDDEAAIKAYRRVLDLNPRAGGAWVNIGTLLYRNGVLEEAEKCYRSALSHSTSYPLAHFDLGNICDELGRFDEAINHYKLALRYQPNYADAHYNLALIYERRAESMRAAKHWREYLTLDRTSAWARIARQQLTTLLKITQGGRSGPAPAKGR